MHSTLDNKKRIINVSNRLPVKITSTNEEITYQASEGGLSTGLSSVFSEMDSLWIGWPGMEVQEKLQDRVAYDLRNKNLHPVFLDAKEINKYYEGFSNEIIWPLFHYFPSYSSYDPEYWQTYLSVNKKFAEEIIKFATTDDIVWVHDYHLMLVPAIVRAALPGITIGYFQHIPFPSNEVFRALPWKKEVLEGLLGADIIGFQTDEDAEHFTHAVSNILAIEAKGAGFQVENDRQVKVQAFPISIDYKKFHDLAKEDLTEKYVQKLKKDINTRILLSIDRLDYSKGIIQRLKAFECFLKKHPEWKQRVTFIHLIVPSRDQVRKYAELKEEMDRLISDINGRYSTLTWQPIHHRYCSVAPNMLSALYRCADMAIVSPLIDGMNLVSKEYVASNISRKGVLLLSEYAGAAKELTDALLINPNDVECFASKINEGLLMPEDKRTGKMKRMQDIIKHADIFNWARNFTDQLTGIRKVTIVNLPTPINSEISHHIDSSYADAGKRLLLLDYDGTLMPFFNEPTEAAPDPSLHSLLTRLASDKRNAVVIISGRDKDTLSSWLGSLPINIVAEHGSWLKEKNGDWRYPQGLNDGWKTEVANILTEYVDKIPGSFIEQKSYSMAWHYRQSDSQLAKDNIRNITASLNGILRRYKLEILLGNKVLEVKSNSINKGKAASYFLKKADYDFILALGDDNTDEDIFAVMPDNGISIKVGTNISRAHYSLNSYLDVRKLLANVCETTLIHRQNVPLAS